MQVQFSGTLKVPHNNVHIHPATDLYAGLFMNRIGGLVRLPQNKLHITLLHQSVEGLKNLCKLVKKFEKGQLSTDPVVYPTTSFPQVDTEEPEVLFVEDTSPTGEVRKTVRIVLRPELQVALGAWVSDFCNLNSLKRDDIEMQRIFHISYANLTGLPADSVR
jgi:hypothetical protein